MCSRLKFVVSDLRFADLSIGILDNNVDPFKCFKSSYRLKDRPMFFSRWYFSRQV